MRKRKRRRRKNRKIKAIESFMSKSIQCHPKNCPQRTKKKKKTRELVLENTIGRVLVDQLLMQPDFLWQNTGNKCFASMLLTNQYCSNSTFLAFRSSLGKKESSISEDKSNIMAIGRDEIKA